MQFLFPEFLYALFWAGIPILIHLFNFRRYKKVVFSDVRFLKNLIEENKKQQTIKKWLILLSRVLAIACLVFAFARPYLSENNLSQNKPNNIHSFYLDNSFSMQSLGKEGSLLDQSKNKVKQLAEAYGESDLFQILTNDFEGKHQRLLNKKDFLQALNEVQPGLAHRNLREILSRQLSLLDGKKADIFWLSDFQKNMVAEFPTLDSNIQLHLLPIQGNNAGNVYIDSAWFPEPILKVGSNNQLKVLIKNEGESDFENQPLVLKVDGVQKMIQNIQCKKGSSQEISMNFPLPDAKWHAIEVSITDYPLIFDDSYFLSAKAGEVLDVLLIQDESQSKEIEKVYGLDSLYRLTKQNMSGLNFASFPRQSAIILLEPKSISSGLLTELQKYVKMGGVLVFIPSNKPSDLTSIQTFLNVFNIRFEPIANQPNRINAVETEDKLFNGVFSKVPDLANLPYVNSYWPLQANGSGFKRIISLGNDLPFLAKSKIGKGTCFIFASNFLLSNTNFAQHALFVPIMLTLPFQSNNQSPNSYTIGKQEFIYLNGGFGGGLLNLNLGNESWVTEGIAKDGLVKAKLNDQMKKAGVYNVSDQGKELAKIALNFNRNESGQGFLDYQQLSQKLNADINLEDTKLLANTLMNKEAKKNFGYLFLIFALLFLLTEMALIRFMK